MIEEFVSKLSGKYNNLKQAQSSPRDHSHVHIEWTNLRDEGRMTIKQWYDYEGESNPYRARCHKVLAKDNSIVVENWGTDWTHSPTFDMRFTLIDTFYKGELIHPDPIIRETSLKSFVEFDGYTYRSMDQGWKGNKLDWGSLTYYELQKEIGF